MDFRPNFCFLAKRKNGCFSVIPAGTRSFVNVGHFLVARTVPPSFVDHSPKLRILINAIGHWRKMAKIWVEPRKMTLSSETDFFQDGQFFRGSPGCINDMPF